MHADGGGGFSGHSGGDSGPASHHTHPHHMHQHTSSGHYFAGQQGADAQFQAYGADPEARHRRARSPAGTVIRWALLTVVMITIIVLVGWAH